MGFNKYLYSESAEALLKGSGLAVELPGEYSTAKNR